MSISTSSERDVGTLRFTMHMKARVFPALATLMMACTPMGQGLKSVEHKPTVSSVTPGPEWSPFTFIIGHWQTAEGGSPGGGRGEFSLLPDLDGKVLVRRNENESPQGRHEDLMVIYREGSAFKAFYVDNENHTIHYTVTPGDRLITLTSDEVPGRPRFRLTYRQDEGSTVDITFALQPPGALDFQTYLKGKVVRRPGTGNVVAGGASR